MARKALCQSANHMLACSIAENESMMRVWNVVNITATSRRPFIRAKGRKARNEVGSNSRGLCQGSGTV